MRTSFTASLLAFRAEAVPPVLSFVVTLFGTLNAQASHSCSKLERFDECYVLQDSILLHQDPSNLIVRLTGGILVADGKVLIADYSESNLRLFGPKGDLLQVVGRRGQGPGEFLGPRVIRQSPNGQLHVLDDALRRISVFDRNYRFLRIVTLPSLGHFTSMVVSSDGYLLGGITPTGIVVASVDSAGRLLATSFNGDRFSKGLSAGWRVLLHPFVAAIAKHVYLVVPIQDSLYDLGLDGRMVRASPIPVPDWPKKPQPPERFDRQKVASWADSFYRPADVYVTGDELVVLVQSGNPQETTTNLLALRSANGQFTTLRDAPAVLDVQERRLLAILDPDPDHRVLGIYRKRP